MASDAPQTRARDAFGRIDRAIETWLDAERDQLVLWLPVGLGLGIAAWLALPDSHGWVSFLCIAGGIAALAATLPIGGRLGRAIAIFALAATVGCGLIWWRANHVAAPRLERAVVAAFTAQVDSVERLAARESVRVRLTPVAAPALPPHIRVNIAEEDAPPDLAVGGRIALRARLMPPPSAAVPGAYDFAPAAWFQQLGATGKALGKVKILAPPQGNGWQSWLLSIRARLSAHIQASAPGAPGGIAAALATGDQGAIPDADADAMRRSGLAHLLSVSGLHITAAVAATMFLVMRLLALSPRLALHAPLLLIAAGAGALTGIGYTLLTGAEVPTIRSCVATLLVLLGIAIGRDAVTLRLVAAGALVVLLLWPESLAGASFQLSFAAVATIVALHEHPGIRRLFLRRDEPRSTRLARELGSLLLTGLAVELALAPIALFHFHRSGLYGAGANIVAIPLTTFVIMPLEALALLFDAAGLGAPFWWLTGKALGALLWIAHHVADAPGAVAALPSMPRGAYALMIAGGLWIGLWRTKLRRLGLLPFIAGAAWAIATPPPDLLITGDGRHMALRSDGGLVVLLRPRTGDYVSTMLAENGGAPPGTLPYLIDGLSSARCSVDLCQADLQRGGRRWRILATRSAYLVDIAEMNRACAAADIVVSERRLPRSCTPRWLKIDRTFLGRSGGIAINLAARQVATVADRTGQHPWAPHPPEPCVSSGAAAPPAGPARAPCRARNAADHKRGWPDRAGSSRPPAGNI